VLSEKGRKTRVLEVARGKKKKKEAAVIVTIPWQKRKRKILAKVRTCGGAIILIR